jgi:hypothetical protein
VKNTGRETERYGSTETESGKRRGRDKVGITDTDIDGLDREREEDRN